MHVNSFLQSTPVLVVAAACSGLLMLGSTLMRSSRARARRVVLHRGEEEASPAHGLGLVIFSPLGTLGLGAVTAFFLLQLFRPEQDGLGRPVVVHFEPLLVGMVLLLGWWRLAYVSRAPTWMFPKWANAAGEQRLSIVADRILGRARRR